ncbi:hypothetical protein, partial [Ralstonia solanacearum species complex bacterium KE055]
PKFDHAPLGRVPKLVRDLDGHPVSGCQGEIHKATGEVLPGQTNAAGKLAPIDSNQLAQMVARFFKQPK